MSTGSSHTPLAQAQRIAAELRKGEIVTEAKIKERPILFSAPMIRALLDGSKTQTRRAIKPQPPEDWDPSQVGLYHPIKVDRRGEEYPGDEVFGIWDDGWDRPYHFGVGDHLWVKENLTRGFLPNILTGEPTKTEVAIYCADGESVVERLGFGLCPWWKNKSLSSIHMPRYASRITLEITKIRVQRVQDISEEDAEAEGFERERLNEEPEVWGTAAGAFRQLWDQLNGDRGFGWEANPWCLALSFKRLVQP